MTVEVVKPGLFSTFQDLGRFGHQALGVPVAGAMDVLAHRLANLLVGNDEAEASLEITLIGPSLRFERARTIVVTGADLDASLDGAPLAVGTPALAEAGATLSFGKRRRGLRGYLGVGGGFDLPAVMGSRSTHTRSGMGGWQGRPLQKGDRLPLRSGATVDRRPPPVLPPAVGELADRLAAAGGAGPIRCSVGREWARFDAASQRAFFREAYRVGAQSERMGYRLEGARLQQIEPRDILSEAVAFGTVQVPAEGLPIILMADRQSTGGYARIAQIAGVDLPRLAQVMPGESVRFERVEVAQAQRLLGAREVLLAELRRMLNVSKVA